MKEYCNDKTKIIGFYYVPIEGYKEESTHTKSKSKLHKRKKRLKNKRKLRRNR